MNVDHLRVVTRGKLGYMLFVNCVDMEETEKCSKNRIISNVNGVRI